MRAANRAAHFPNEAAPGKNLARMLLDLLEYAVTPCSWEARSLGFLRSSLQVQARYRRCRRAWEPHLARTRAVILEAANLCAERRRAVILGAGLLHDIPLRELAERFHEVVLVDVIFPWASRIRAARFRNVRCLTADVTAIARLLPHVARSPGAPLPRSRPALFRDDPELDLTVSVNLLSQLPFIPTSYLRERGFDEEALRVWSRHLQDAHLAYLRQLRGHVALITDVGGEHRDHSGTVLERWDNLNGLELPAGGERWDWNIAPAPEVDPGYDRVVHVAAFPTW